MRKLKLQMQTSVDGFVSTGPNDDQSWVTWAWKEIRPQVLDLLDSSDTILLGRKLAIDYIPHWENIFSKTDDPMYEIAERIVPAKKVVFTKTLDKSVWKNTTIAKGSLSDEVNKIKNQPGKDIIVYGGRSFVSSLIKEGLIDEFYLFVNPVALGRGEPIFSQLTNIQQMSLLDSITCPCGIVLLNYKANRTTVQK
jgi:dihydrofolate reductase